MPETPDTAALPLARATSPSATSARHLILLCAAIFALLAAWVLVWRYSGDGDAVLHYLLAQRGMQYPSAVTSAYARPLHKLLFILPVQGGVLCARLFGAVVSIVTAWQTVRLAQDVKLPRSLLAAVLLVFQPVTFALAAETMTEMPMALGIVLALRLWLRNRFITSCLVVSFLPMARPEGNFLLPLWALFVLVTPQAGPVLQRLLKTGLLATGLLCWLVLCRIANHDWLWVYHSWFWTPDSRKIFPPGPLLHYVRHWGEFCGPVLLVLFIVGIIPSLKRRIVLPWAVWLLVFCLHSFMYWKGLFMSLGLLRWVVPTAPITAIICLYGWNVIAAWVDRLNLSDRTRRAVAAAALALIILAPLAYYAASSERYQTFPLRRCAQYIRDNHLLDSAPDFFTGDKVLLAELGRPDDIRFEQYDHDRELKTLSALPSGAIGVWDNRQALMWHHVEIEELQQLGFTILYDARLRAPDFLYHLHYGGRWFVEERYVVLRKN